MSTRERVVDYLRRRLVGPIGDPEEEITDDPMNLYTAGILHPQPLDQERGDADRAAIDNDEGHLLDASHRDGGDADDDDEPLVLASQHYPSVIGVSFLLGGAVPVVDVDVKFAIYEKAESIFKRRCFQANTPSGTSFRLEQGAGATHELMDGRARLRGIFRRHRQGWLVTVVLMNHKHGGGKATDNLFQPAVTCHPGPGCTIQPWPRPRAVAGGSEVARLEMTYRHRQVYAVGHGCAAQWDASAKPPMAIWSEVMPALEVPVTAFGRTDSAPSPALRIAWIAGDPPELIDELGRFVTAYETWIDELDAGHEAQESMHAAPRADALVDLRKAVARMHAGVAVLSTDAPARRAFCLASKAMLAQMRQTAGYRDRPRNESPPSPPRVVVHDPADTREWRPFQLAFQLLVLASLVEPDADLEPDRKVVDLLWFPTGGGKTEAYLALVAFELFYRRLRYGARGGGTAVIMRYSLRLLTTQQFQRATALICAAELLRRVELPDAPLITIGLWVGGSQTPNTIEEAEKNLTEDLYGGHPPRNPFVIDRCGWCGAFLVPAEATDVAEAYGFTIVGDGARRRLDARCVRPDCPFHNRLPVVLIDPDIYRSPPSFLLGTVDKFARLAWVDEAGAIFGASGDHRPPSLIIQDELHLINGPLGTIVGVYEAAIEEIASQPGNTPKIIAATATIRSVSDQVRALYNRDVAVFPPPGLDAADAYFARDDVSRPGRLFVGVFSDSHSGPMIIARVLAALLHAPDALSLRGDERDAYWTLVGYHNSLRELGRVNTLAIDDVPNWIRTFADARSLKRQFDGGSVEELTSNRTGADLVELLDRLGRRFDDPRQVSLLLTTNMFSVGVDIDRLGLMFVNGQPKGTSEYIQATSRVGRASVPGLVVTYYSASKPRDRSHYEQFQAYHQALYRSVEPMSVTPFAEPARRRALHAALVIIVRHKLGLANERAGDFGSVVRPTPAYAEARHRLLERVRSIDPVEYERAKHMLDEFESAWAGHVAGHRLRYYSRSRQFTSLLASFDENSSNGILTLNSMRNVDHGVVIQNVDRKHRSR